MEQKYFFVKGECMEMCPIKEINMREKERLLHTLEVVSGSEKNNKPKADRARVVKCFSRSAAGKEMQDPKNLRPPEVLLKTVNYLLNEVIVNTTVPWNITYDFVMDRLRSVRQDMVIQNVSLAYSMCILQPIVRFHAYAQYRSCNEPLSYFDPFLNKTHLQECLKRLLCLYDECDILYLKTEVTKNSYSMQKLAKIRPEFEALYLILNLGSTTALRRALNLDKKWRCGAVDLAMQLSLSYYRNNFVKVCYLMKDLPVLLLAVASLHLPEIRRRSFQIMSVAYSSKNLTFPLDVLKDIFLFEQLEDVIRECQYYGLECKGQGVQFIKDNFDNNASCTAPCSLSDVKARNNSGQNNPVISSQHQYIGGVVVPTPVTQKFPIPDPGRGQIVPSPLPFSPSPTKMASFAPISRDNLSQGSATNNPPAGIVGSRSMPETTLKPEVESSQKIRISQSGVLYTLNMIREPVVEYQESRGIPRNEEITFVTLVTSLCTQAYTAAITILVMLWNLMPLVDGLVYFVRFFLDKLIDIVQTPDNKDKAIKGAIFFGELTVVTFIIFMIVGLIFMPVYVLMARLFSKVFSMIAW